MNNQELQHHGVIGMKWGVRRYQNKDGTLTPRGKKRYEKELAKLSKEERILKNKIATKAKLDKLAQKRRELDEMNEGLTGKKKMSNKPVDSPKDTSPRLERKMSKPKKPISEMSDDELRDVVKRLENEKKFREFNPEKKSLGRRFVEKAFKDVLVPVATDYAKKQLGNALGNMGKSGGNSKTSKNSSSSASPSSKKKEKVYTGTVVGEGKSRSKHKQKASSTTWDYNDTWSAQQRKNYADVGAAYVNNVLKLLK